MPSRFRFFWCTCIVRFFVVCRCGSADTDHAEYNTDIETNDVSDDNIGSQDEMRTQFRQKKTTLDAIAQFIRELESAEPNDVGKDAFTAPTQKNQKQNSSLLCRGAECVFSRARPGHKARLEKSIDKFCMWCDTAKLEEVLKKKTGQQRIRQSLNAFLQHDEATYQKALERLPDGFETKSEKCSNKECVFSLAQPGQPAYVHNANCKFCMWCDENWLQTAENHVHGQKRILTSLSKFRSAPCTKPILAEICFKNWRACAIERIHRVTR